MAGPIASGETVKISGQYVQIARNNRIMLDGREATLVAGEPAPPTAEDRWRWKLVDATKHEDSQAGSLRHESAAVQAPAGPYRGRGAATKE